MIEQQRALQAGGRMPGLRGLGDINDVPGWIFDDPVWVEDPTTVINSGSATPGGGAVIYYPTNTNQQNPWSAQIPSLIAGGIQTIRDIFAPVGSTQAAYGAQRQPIVYAGAQQGAVPVRNTGGVGIGIDGQGIRLSDGSHISWIWIIGGIVIIYLIQSPGFSRRRNPTRKLLAKRNPSRSRSRSRRRNPRARTGTRRARRR
jgi:hypothetical protein